MSISASDTSPKTSVNLKIEGMTCASCVSHVEKALSRVPGVESANVNLARETARVVVTPGSATVDDLTKAVERAGYSARPDVPVIPGHSHHDMDGAPDSTDHMHHGGPRRDELILAIVLTVPVLLMAMVPDMVPALDDFIRTNLGIFPWRVTQALLTTVVLFGPGRVFFKTGIPALLRGAPEMNSLVALGTFAAWTYSIVATFLPQVFPAGTANVYFEAAAVIATLVLLGRYMEAHARREAGSAIEHLLRLAPDTATVLRDGAPVEVKLDTIVPGDILLIRPGDRVPLDGEVIDGASLVDESMLTGESQPVNKALGAQVFGGTVNSNGSLTIRVTKVGADTVLARIVHMVGEAQGAKLPVQALADRVTGWFVPAVIAVALLTFVLWFAFGPRPSIAYALVNMVAVLIVACPCAMGLATPVSVMVATGRSAQLGILFRDATALQTLRDVSVIAFDKTGTLTEGHPALTDIEVAAGFDADKIVAAAAAVEALSEHPLGKALVAAAKARGLAVPKAVDFQATPGFGVTAAVDSQAIAIGSARFMAKLGVDVSIFDAAAATLSEAGKSPLFVALGQRAAAILAVADPVKPSAQAAIAALKKDGLSVAMVSGDRKATAEAVGRALGIDRVEAEVLPEGKAAAVKDLRPQGGKIAFVGDGINDAPALAAADVGLAVGTGTDIAIETADVVMMRDDLGTVASAIDLSRATLRNISQNLFWALAYNVILIPVAAGALYGFGHILLSPMLAAAAMAFSSLFVVGNAMRLRRFQPRA
ncbi:heavy metal translocating P-type ATPase [uncultured Methylovirgula sp.]|uniref:heavy metal translocating P-type ATPase n=1 Tax=uncultured Methylovirgula sp. TaxID=1285960 RepID=UPI00260B40E4|nr:heavy metal translocating P-type ATPase [uncultured Methylovirgula sp.]